MNLQLLKKHQIALVFAVLDLGGKGLYLGLPIVFALFISQADFGRYSLGITVVYFFLVFTAQALRNSSVVLGSQAKNDPGQLKKVIMARVNLTTITLILSCFLLIIFAGPINQFVGYEDANLGIIPALCVALLGFTIKQLLEDVYLAQGQRVRYAIFTFFCGLISLLYLALILWNQPTLEVTSLFVAYFVGPVIPAVGLIIMHGVKPFLNWRFQAQTLQLLFQETAWMYFGLAAMAIINWGDNLALRYFGIEFDEIGEYGFAYQFLKAFIIVATTLVTFFLPQFAEKINDVEYLKKYFSSRRYTLYVLWLALNLLVYIGLSIVIPLVYGPEYDKTVPLLWILAVASLSLIHKRIYDPLFNALKLYRFLQLASIFMVVVNVGLNLLLIPIWGVYGTAISTAIAYIAASILYEWRYRTGKEFSYLR